MATGTLTIDLSAVAANWRALDAATGVDTGAVVKADGYGLGAAEMATTLARAGARRFFVAVTEEAAILRAALGPMPDIFVFSGHMAGDSAAIRDLKLTPLLNSIEQMTRHFELLHGHPFGIQLDTGMNRLGLEPAEWAAARDLIIPQNPALIMSHLACADEPDHAMNMAQLKTFRDMTDGVDAPRSLAATGGILLGPAFHFDLTRPGVGLYGGLPFEAAQPVASLSLPIIQTRTLHPGETVGYGGSWSATQPTRIATVSAGYADGLIRAIGPRGQLWHRGRPCPIAGRISMDLIGVDITHLESAPETLDVLGPDQGVDDLADAAGTIGYEVLTALGARYKRVYLDGPG